MTADIDALVKKLDDLGRRDPLAAEASRALVSLQAERDGIAAAERRIAILEDRVQYALRLIEDDMLPEATFELDRVLSDPDMQLSAIRSRSEDRGGERHLSVDEQRSFQRALRRSVAVVPAPAASSPTVTVEELARVLERGIDVVSGTWDGIYQIDDEIDWVKDATTALNGFTARNTVASPISQDGSIDRKGGLSEGGE